MHSFQAWTQLYRWATRPGACFPFSFSLLVDQEFVHHPSLSTGGGEHSVDVTERWRVLLLSPYSQGYVTNTNWSHRQFSTDREKKSKWNTLVTQRLLTFNINLVGNRRHLSISGHSKLFWSCTTKTSQAEWIIQGSIKSMHTLISNGWIGSSHLATSPDLGATLACMSKPHPWRFDVPPSLLLHPCMSNLKISRPSRS